MDVFKRLVNVQGENMFFKRKNRINEVLTTDSFNELFLDLKSVNLNIKSGDHFEIRFKGLKSNKPELKIDGEKAKLVQNYKQNNFLISINTGRSNLVIVTIPKEQTLLEVNIENVSGNVKIEDQGIEELNLRAASGSLDIKGGHIENTRVDVASGDVEFESVSLNTGEIKLTSGGFEMKGGEITGELSVSNVSGDNFAKEVNVDSCVLNTVSGDSRLNGVEVKSGKVSEKLDGSLLEMSSVSGDNEVK